MSETSQEFANNQKRGSPPAWGLSKKLLTVKSQCVTKFYTGPQTWFKSLKQPEQWKMDIRFGTWNARDLCKLGSEKTLLRKVKEETIQKTLVWMGI
jgi:hypothetical protein